MALYDEMPDYVTALVEYISEKWNVEALGFSQKEAFSDYLERHRMDVTLVGENVMCDEFVTYSCGRLGGRYSACIKISVCR